MKKGKLIVLEGISGTGKETQARLLRDFLVKQGIRTRVVYHPSPELKKILAIWRKTRNIDHVSEAYFLLADRYNRVQEVIKPALSQGEWVITLRNYISALVYQAETVSQREYLKKEFAWFEPKPDVLFYFDMPPRAAMERILKRRKETGEPLGKFETPAHLSEKRNQYRQVLRTVAHIVIDATQSIEAIQKLIRRCLHLRQRP